MSRDLIPSIAIEGLVKARAEIESRVAEARRLMIEARKIAKGLGAGSDDVARCLILEQRNHSGAGRWFCDDTGLKVMMEKVDSSMWQMLMDRSGLWSLLDETARGEWRRAIDDAPELNAENIRATFKGLYERRSEFFDRGVLALFRKLSWDYKTNNPRKFGRRLILERAVGTWKDTRGTTHFNMSGDRMDDLLRVLAVAAGHPEPTHALGVVAQAKAQGWTAANPTVVIGVLGVEPACPLFTMKGHRNGNVHVAFSRIDLVDNLNRIVAKHHPNALPPAEVE